MTKNIFDKVFNFGLSMFFKSYDKSRKEYKEKIRLIEDE